MCDMDWNNGGSVNAAGNAEDRGAGCAGMRNYRMTVQYDGSRYRGWQVQKSTDMTIQGKLQNVLESLAGGSSLRI